MRKGLDASCTQYRKEREDFRIKKLWTVYQYGLNVDLCDSMTMRKDNEVMVGRHLCSLGRTRFSQSRGIKYETPNKIRGKKFPTKAKSYTF